MILDYRPQQHGIPCFRNKRVCDGIEHRERDVQNIFPLQKKCLAAECKQGFFLKKGLCRPNCQHNHDKKTFLQCGQCSATNPRKCINCATNAQWLRVHESGYYCINPCIAGMEPDDIGRCVSCKGGTFKNFTAAEPCLTCQRNQFSGQGASICNKCECGKFSNPGDPNCSFCPIGKIRNLQMSECQTCPKNFIPSNNRCRCEPWKV